MSNTSAENYDEIKYQLDEIKSVLNISASAFRLVYAANNFRKLFFVSGIFSLALPLIYQILLWLYGSASAIPKDINLLYYILIASSWIALLIIRTKTSIVEAKKLGIKENLFTITKSILSSKIFLALLPLIVIAVLIPTKFSFAFTANEFIPYIGIILGLILNIIGVSIHEREYSFCGIWMIASASLLFFVFSFPAHIAFAIIFAPGCFLFNIASKRMVK